MALASGVQFEASQLAQGIRNYPKKTRDKISEIMEEVGKEMEAYAQANARWEDRTGEAREGLTAEVTGGFEAWSKNQLELTLSYSVDYGIWLELRWGGRYAIIIPTVEKFGPELMRRMNGITEDIIYYA